jgi:hypothetical protein
VELAPAFVRLSFAASHHNAELPFCESAGKPDALHTLRVVVGGSGLQDASSYFVSATGRKAARLSSLLPREHNSGRAHDLIR